MKNRHKIICDNSSLNKVSFYRPGVVRIHYVHLDHSLKIDRVLLNGQLFLLTISSFYQFALNFAVRCPCWLLA
ncbi:hypothetical protein FGO68_gene13550 [Halteria grandinella]|uniref:Uncharacterized protein n=1 Tax=Halteria grandinella TaxID=5974 RepID=A0A8J8T1X0_HALGN|nr:hypothetical protein FGO68_gene13550 [Halteria grandinella]